MSLRRLLHLSLVAGLALAWLAGPAGASIKRHQEAGHLTFASPQSRPLALTPDGSLLLVASTTSGLVDVIDTASLAVIAQVVVGMEPVGIALKPDGSEAWVANHVSDSVSVIDTDPASPTFLEVVETVQALADGVTAFDEPVGVAFASDAKAYVSLSSRNQVAVVDTASYAVTGTLPITAQDPRALRVANGRLYVAAFESHNQSQLSVCSGLEGDGIIGSPCSIGLLDFVDFATDPNLPSIVKNIVPNPNLPDRDLFVFDTSDDSLIKTVTGVGTLLYGLAVDAADRVYVTTTDARNMANGDHDSSLADLDNEMFDNLVRVLDCGVAGASCDVATTVDLDPSPPDPALSLATPYGIDVSGDGQTLLATAMGVHRIFSLDASGAVLDRLDVGALPKDVVLASDAQGAPARAYVLNTLDNSVTVVDASDPTALQALATIGVGDDPTPDAVRRGRIAFNNALASDSGNFSCGSCHPDSHTDQLLWRIGAECPLIGCGDGAEPRSTQPIRGLRDTEPLHWGGELGDPFGGGNGSVGPQSGPGNPLAAPNCDRSITDGRAGTAVFPDPPNGDCMRQLVDAALSGVMCDQAGGCSTGPSGAAGRLDDAERRDMAIFLRSVSYPVARMRPVDDQLSDSARTGFKQFFMDQGGNASLVGGGGVNTCADSDSGCHELPLGTATVSEVVGSFESPTMRGMMDRFLQFSMGITMVEPLMVLANFGFSFGGFSAPPSAFPYRPEDGLSEEGTLSASFLLFKIAYNADQEFFMQMTEEATNGHSGAVGRQVTLNTRTTGGSELAGTEALLAALEAADDRGVVNLRGKALFRGAPATLSWNAASGRYFLDLLTLTRAQVLSHAQAGELLATLTATLPTAVSEDTPQPLIAPRGANCGTGAGPTGDPALPSGLSLAIEGAHVTAQDAVFVNGFRDPGASIALGGIPTCTAAGRDSVATDDLVVTLSASLASGMHLLQVQTPDGLMSNELPFCFPAGSDCR